MPSRPRVAIAGSLHYDIMVRAPGLPRIGETLMGDAWWCKPGGKGGNQAMAAALHGADARMIGALGDDGFGAFLRERLAASGVDITSVRTVDRGSGMSVAIERPDGDYGAIVVSGANSTIDEASIAACADTIRASWVLLLQSEIPQGANVAAARLARDAGVVVVLNAAPARPIGALAGLLDVLVVNTVEAEMLGAGVVDDLASASVAAVRLLSLAPTVIVTAGGAGVAAAFATPPVPGSSHPTAVAPAAAPTTLTVPAHPVAGAQTHGAGDMFVGALATRLAADAPLVDALRYANAAAALHVGTPEADRAALGPADVWRLLGVAEGTAIAATGDQGAPDGPGTHRNR